MSKSWRLACELFLKSSCSCSCADQEVEKRKERGLGAGVGWQARSGWPAQSSCHWPLANDSVSVRSTLRSCCRSDGVRLFVGENFQGRAKTWSGQFIDSAL